jgi:hypothetical protein
LRDWLPVIVSARSRPPGRARNCCARSMPPVIWRAPGPRWIVSIAGATACNSSSCPAWPAPCGPGRPRSWPGTGPPAAPWAHRGDQSAHQESEAGWAWLS